MADNLIDRENLERLTRKLGQPGARLTACDRAILVAALGVAAATVGGQPIEPAAAPAGESSIADQFRQGFIPGALTARLEASSIQICPDAQSADTPSPTATDPEA